MPTHISPGEEPRALNIDRAAAYLDTSVRHMRRLAAERRLPYVKVGGKVRFLPEDLDAFLQAGRVEAL